MNDTGAVMQLQREAAERVRRMQEQSRRLVREHPINVYRGVSFTPPTMPPPPPADDNTPPLPATHETPCATEKPAPCPTGIEGLTALAQGDEERLLILLLVVVLAKNGAPLELLLALLYVAM